MQKSILHVLHLLAVVPVLAMGASAITFARTIPGSGRVPAVQSGQSPVWQHSDVYETALKDGDTEYRCTIVVKGNQAEVTVESRTRASVGVTANGKAVTFQGHTQRFTIDRLPDGTGKAGPSTWTNDAEAEDRVKHRLMAKSGPSAQETLQVFADALTELPPPVAALFKNILRTEEKK